MNPPMPAVTCVREGSRLKLTMPFSVDLEKGEEGDVEAAPVEGVELEGGIHHRPEFEAAA